MVGVTPSSSVGKRGLPLLGREKHGLVALGPQPEFGLQWLLLQQPAPLRDRNSLP